MKKNTFKLFLLIMVFILSNLTLAQVNWTKCPDNPVLPGQPGTWYAYVTMNSVLYNADSSRYEMWFTAGAQVSFPYTIGYAWSYDGITWHVRSSNPVLTPTSGEWDAYTVLAPYVLRENGQYKMWYTGCATAALLNRIGYATSPDGINWAKHTSNPVFEPGTEPWESGSVAYGCVMPYSNGYKMWYGGGSSGWTQTAIGYAISPDGITWERYTGNPVLSPGEIGQWDHLVFGPRVLYIDNAYYMFYSGEIILWNSDKIGLATSSDGLAWTKYPSNPVLQPTPGQWDGSRINLGSVIMDSDTLKMYYTGMNSSNMQIGLATSLFSPPLLPGTYSVGTSGYFTTIQAAFDKLETDGVAGNVTLELIDELYTATTSEYGFLLNGPIPGAGPNSRITIKPAENKNVIVEGNGEGIFHFNNTSYLILDGVGISGPTTLTVHNLVTTPVSYNDAIDFIGNCDHNVVQNTIALTEDITRVNCGVIFWPETNVIGTPDSNLVQNNFIMKATYGIYLGANQFQGSKASGNIIRGNIIGSETDSLISCAGIQTERVENTIIENNLIRNIKRQVLTFWEPDTYGINTWEGIETVIRNNVIHNLSSNLDWGIIGILVSASSPGVNNMIYNNIIFNINSTSIHSDSRVAGIQIYNQVNPKIYYNSVYLTGNGNGANPFGSAALILPTGITNADVKNNVFVNTRDESPYCASAIYDYSASNLTSDYNDLYSDDTNNNNCLVRIGSTNYNTLADWQATTQDLHSYVEMPHFIEPYLHISETDETYLESRGTPITGIDIDYDGDTRNATTPDIGADEFDGIPVGVEDETTLPTEFALEQNYPNPFNPSTVIEFSLPENVSNVKLSIYNTLGEKVAELVNTTFVAGKYSYRWNAQNVATGMYIYELRTDKFISVKKMVLLK